DAGELDQLVKRGRQLAAVPLDERLPKLGQRVRLVTEEAGRLEQLLELGPVGRGVIGSGRVSREELRRHLVDPLVGGLRGENRRDSQLKGVAEVELAVRVG